MPIHKNAVRQKRFTFVFIGTYTRQSNADSTSYLGIVQDFVSNVDSLSIDADILPLTFSGVAGGTERVDNSEDNLDRWVVNCMNHADDRHEYDAEDLRNSALAALNNTTWHNFASGLDFTPEQLGSWQAEDEGNGRYDLAWIPADENTAQFADDHPVGINQQSTTYVNIADNFTPTEFTTDFSPITAILDVAAITVTLTASSASNMVDNQYWAVGRKFGTNDDGTQVPQWIGTVKSRTIETDGSATIVLDVDSGLPYLAVKAAEFEAGGVDPNNIEQLFTTGRHFVVLNKSLYLYMIDQINDANLGYTVEGNCTQDDISGDVSIGEETKTYNVLKVNLTAVDDISGNDFRIRTIPGLVVSTQNGIGTEIRILNNSGNDITGTNILFVRVPTSAGSTPLAKLTRAAELLTASTYNGISLTCTVSGTDNDATMIMIPREAPGFNIWSGTTSNFSDWTGSVSFDTEGVKSPVFLSLADDVNRIGTTAGITFTDTGYVSRTTDYGDLPNFTMARGSSLTLGNGFTMNIGLGYDVSLDAKDGIFTTEYNSVFKCSGQAKEAVYGGKITKDASNNNVVYPINATTDNPMTVIQRQGGQHVLDLDPNIDAPVFGNRTFFSGRSGAQRDGSIQWIVDSGSTGFYNSKGIPFVYVMQGAKKDQSFFINAENGNTTYVPTNAIKEFTGATLYFGPNNELFQFSTAPTDTSATDTRAQSYNSMWVAHNYKLLGEAPETITAFNPITNYLWVDPEDNDGVYNGGANFRSRPITSKGVHIVARLWNPIWEYANEPLTALQESYYYGKGVEVLNLDTMKEGVEDGDIGTVAANEHPFNDAITISSTHGLADVKINGSGINRYKSDNSGTSTGWGDTNSDVDGLALVFTKGDKPDVTEAVNVKLTATQHATDWFAYSRRDGFRPRFVANPFSGILSSYQPVTSMEPFLDIYWQANTVAAIDSYVANFETVLWVVGPPSYDSVNNRLTVNIPTTTVANELYRFVEYSENKGSIINANLASETRPYADNTNGRFIRFINTAVPVTTNGDINITDYNLELELNGSLSRSTGSNSIRGIDLGTTKSMIFKSTSSGNYVISLDLKAKDFTFTETDGSISATDAVFNNTDDQTYSIALDNTVVNSTGDVTFTDSTSDVTVNTDSRTTISRATTGMITNGTGSVRIDNVSNNGRFGTPSVKHEDIRYNSVAVSNNDTGYASGFITLASNTTDGFFDSGSSIARVNLSGITTDTELTAVTYVSLNSMDGGNVICGGGFTANGSLVTTTVQAIGAVSITGSATSSAGIGINGSTISILGNTVGCEANAVTTFSTNDITTGSDVSAGTSVSADVIDNSKVVSPIVSCDYIQNEANVDATTSIDVDISMTGGSADSATINIDVDLTGGTATASGTLTVPLISGAQTTANAGTLVATTVSSGFVNFSGNGSTVTNINGGIFGGTGDLTTTNQIGGGDFGANITLLSVPTNTAATSHLGNYADSRMEMTNSGAIEFNQSASGFATITAGPATGTARVVSGGVTFTVVADNGTNNTDNVIIEVDPFTVTVNFPTGGVGRVELPDGTISSATSFDEGNFDRGNTIKVGYIEKGFAMFYLAVTIEDIPKDGTQVINVNPVTQAYSNTADIPAVTEVNTIVFNDDNLLVIDVDNVVQQADIMNKLLIETVMSNVETIEAMFHYESADIFGSDGTIFFANTDRVRLTSSTASGVGTKETNAFFRPSNAATSDEFESDQYLLTALDLALGQSIIQSAFTTAELSVELNRRKLTEGTLENAQLNIPEFGPDQ